jgi:hypothetical protein
MVAESQQMAALFDMLFSEEGDELYVRDIRHYLYNDEGHVSFWELSRRASLVSSMRNAAAL